MNSDTECFECGESPTYKLLYLIHDEESGDIQEARLDLCTDHFFESGEMCQKHGPCVATNSGLFVSESLRSVERDAVVHYCPKCIHKTLKDMGKKERNSYRKLLNRYLDYKDRFELQVLERMFLKEKTWARYPTLAYCTLSAHISSVTVEAVVLQLIDKSEHQSPLYEPPKPRVRLYDELPQ